MAETVAQFAARIKSKYPDYSDVPDQELVQRIVSKYPDYASQVDMGGGQTKEDLQAAHAKNVAAEEAAYKPSWIEAYQTGATTGGGPGGLVSVAQQMGKDVGAAIEETPQRIGGMIAGVPELAKSMVLPPALGGGVPPVLKKMIEGTTDPLISPRTTGKALTEAGIDTLLTAGTGKALSYGAKTVGPAAARRIIQSIIKPVKGELQFGKDPVGAVLEEKLTGNSLPNYLENVSTRKGELIDKVQQKIASSTKKTPLNDVFSILDGEEARLKNSIGVANKDTLLNRIDTLREEIANKYPNDLTQTELHKLRKEIDSSIPRFTSEAVEQEANKLKYNLRSGINDILENNNPGIAKSNKRVSELIDVENALGRRINQAQNAPLAPAGSIPGEILGTVLGHPGVYTGARFAGMALGSPAVLTRAANVLNTFAPKRGLAGALERTQPARGFRGDIRPAVAPAATPPPIPQAVPSLSQAATQLSPPGPGPAGPAATVPSPQPADGLGAAIAEPPMVPPPANLPPGMQQIPGLAAIIDEIVKRQQMPRSALESTPTLMAPEESLTLSKVRPITGGSGLSGALEAQGATAPINLLSKEPVTAKIPPKSPSLAEFDIRVLDGLDAEGGYNYTALNDFPKGNPNVPDLKAKIGPQLQKLQEQGIAGKSIKDLKALPIEDTAKVSELKESFAKHGDKPEGFAAKRIGLPTLEIRPGGKMILTNGRHRLEAARQAGLKELKFHVQKFDPDGDMLWDAITPVRISEGPLRRQKIWYTKEK